MPQVDQGFAVDHFQDAFVAVSDAHVAADAISGVDRQRGFQQLFAARVFLGELADGAGHLARAGHFEFGFQTIERRLRFDLDRAHSAEAEDRLIAAAARLQLLEFFKVFDRGADDGRVRPRQWADADRLVGVRVDLLGQHAAFERMTRGPLEDRQGHL